jgi:heterodisulfide reductase subunit A-like polyferredoxin
MDEASVLIQASTVALVLGGRVQGIAAAAQPAVRGQSSVLIRFGEI